MRLCQGAIIFSQSDHHRPTYAVNRRHRPCKHGASKLARLEDLMHQPLHTRPLLIPAWDPSWDDVTAVEELELELTASDFRVGATPALPPFGTLDTAAPPRTDRPPRQRAHRRLPPRRHPRPPTRLPWLMAAGLFFSGSSVFLAATVVVLLGLVIALSGETETSPLPPTVTLAAVSPQRAPVPEATPTPVKTMPAVRTQRRSRTRRAPAKPTSRVSASSRGIAAGEEVVELSVSQLRTYFSEPKDSPGRSLPASQLPASRAPVPPPQKSIAPAYKSAPAPRARPLPPPTPRPTSSGAKVVLFDGYPPLDPVHVTVIADTAGVQVAVDGQPMGAAPLRLSLDAGSHQVVLATPKGAASSFTMVAGEGDAWCFASRGAIKSVACKKLK